VIEQTPESKHELHRINSGLLRLEMISQADSQSFNPAPAEKPQPQRWRIKDNHEPIPHIGTHGKQGGGTKIPTGGIKNYDDKQFDYRQKSPEFFRSRLKRWDNDPKRTYRELDLARLAVEIEDTIYDCQHTPIVAGVETERNSFLWKCEIADAPGKVEDVMRKYSAARRTVERYRAQYRGLRKRAA